LDWSTRAHQTPARAEFDPLAKWQPSIADPNPKRLIDNSMNNTTILSVAVAVALASLSAFGSARTTPNSGRFGIDAAPTVMIALPCARPAPQSPVFLGLARNFTALAKSGISTTGTTTIRGDIGVSPIDSTGLTGFGLVMHASNYFSLSALVRGKVYAPDYALRTQTFLTQAVNDMETAYTDAAGRTLPDFTELGAGNIGGMTLAPGLYKWSTGVTIPSNGVALAGNGSSVWVFQIAQNLTVDNGAIVTLTGGAQASSVFWQVGGQATLGTTVDFNGVILSQTAIVMNTGAKLIGRALAQTAVTLDASTVWSR
jgi:hypothetical protein